MKKKFDFSLLIHQIIVIRYDIYDNMAVEINTFFQLRRSKTARFESPNNVNNLNQIC